MIAGSGQAQCLVRASEQRHSPGCSASHCLSRESPEQLVGRIEHITHFGLTGLSSDHPRQR